MQPDSKTIATGGNAQPVRLWDAATGKEVRKFEGHEGRAGTVAFSPDGKTLVSGGDDATVRLWDVATGKETKQLEGHRNAVQSVRFSPDGKSIASASSDATVRLWDAATGKQERRLEVPTSNGGIIFVAFSADGKTVALGRTDQVVRFWERETGRELTRFEAPAAPAGATGGFAGGFPVVAGGAGGFAGTAAANVALSPDGKVVATGQAGGKIRLWDRTDGKEVLPGDGHQQSVQALAFSPDGKTMATGSADRTVRLWDVATGKELRRQEGHSGAVSALAFSPDGKTLASGSNSPNDRGVSLWDVATGRELRQVRLSHGATKLPNPGFNPTNFVVTSLAFSPDGKRLVTQGSDGLIDIWDPATGKSVRHLPTQCQAFAFAPDGKIACGTAPASLQLVDPETGEAKPIRLASVAPPEPRKPGAVVVIGGAPGQSLSGIAYSPDGKAVMLSASDGSVSFFDLASGKQLRKVAGPAANGAGGGGGFVVNRPGFFQPNAVGRPRGVYSPDGRTAAVFATDGVVRLFEVATGQERCHYSGHDGSISAIAFSPDGRLVASAGADTTVLLWDVTRPSAEAPKAELGAKEVEAFWAELAGEDGAKAYRGVLALAAAPGQAVPFLKGQLKPATSPDAKRIPGLIKDLDSEEFAVRKKAADDLQGLGEFALPALRKLLEEKPPLDIVRRVESILEHIDGTALSPEQARDIRAVEALERAGTAEAKKLLETLATGAPEVRITREARMALDRLAKRPGGKS